MRGPGGPRAGLGMDALVHVPPLLVAASPSPPLLPHLSSGVTDSTRALWWGFSEDGPWKELIVRAQRPSWWRCISVSDDHE